MVLCSRQITGLRSFPDTALRHATFVNRHPYARGSASNKILRGRGMLVDTSYPAGKVLLHLSAAYQGSAPKWLGRMLVLYTCPGNRWRSSLAGGSIRKILLDLVVQLVVMSMFGVFECHHTAFCCSNDSRKPNTGLILQNAGAERLP